MKKSLLWVLATGGFTSVSALAGGPEMMPIASPDYFSGFFVGGTGAFHMTAFNGNSSIVATQDVIVSLPPPPPPTIAATVFTAGTLANNDISSSAYSGYYGVQGGVGKAYNHRWYTGVVGFGEWDSQSVTNTNSSQFPVNQVVIDGNAISTGGGGSYNSSTTVKINNDYGVAFKPGFLVAPTSMVYGKVGAVWANLQVSNSVAGSAASTYQVGVKPPVVISSSFSGSSSNQDTKAALLLGVGFEQFIYKNFITINVEYDYANYGHVSTSTNLAAQATSTASGKSTPLDISSTPTIQANADARVSTLLGGLNFYFGSQWF